ncbi:hypothetical protein [Schinkia azotoformans]|uniref:hypothetical protein n=1 Tax=Schinkia azotoformans TaxID=1454 RepID=UPI002DBEB1BE|nr:hypothetical protein [Schinkia azotoformans]MEC1744152.1 hypothetical protein [Schinkia azotoformans]
MKHQLNLLPTEHRVILAAVRSYRTASLKDGKSYLWKQIDIAYYKLIYSMKPRLDGMEMIIIVKALRRRANLFMLLKKETERNLYLELANQIDLEKQRFQEQNNPLRKRKTASAPTLTA